MTFVIELDEGTAARRRVPFKLFTSDGTTPDTGASGDSVMYSVNGGAQSDLTASVISANAGMYYAEFAAADVDTLGTIAVWHDIGDFEQHVANVNVVNYNPMSDQSNIPLVATVTDVTNQVTANATAISGDATAADNLEAAFDGTGYTSELTITRVSTITLDPVVHTGATVPTTTAVTNQVGADVTGISGDATAADNLEAAFDGTGYTSALTITRVSTITLDPVTHTGATVPTTTAVTNQVTADATAISGDATAANNLEAAFDGTGYDSGLTVFVKDSIATIAGVTNAATLINALNDIDGSGVTLHAGTHSSVTIQGVTNVSGHAAGAIVAADFGAGAIDAAALATDAVNEIADGILDRDMSTGADSGSSAVRNLRDGIRAIRNRVESDTTQIYVYEEDDTTIKWTASLVTVVSTNDHISGADPNS